VAGLVATVQLDRGCTFFVVVAHMQIFVDGVVRYELLKQRKLAVAAAGTHLQLGFDKQDCASQIAARLNPQRASSSRNARGVSGAFL